MATQYFGVCDINGNTTGTFSNNDEDLMNWGPYTCPGSGNQSVVSIAMHVGNASSFDTGIRCAIYDSTGTTLLGQSSALTITSGTLEAWQEMTPPSLTLVGGTVYLLAITFGASSGSISTSVADNVNPQTNFLFPGGDKTGGFPTSVPAPTSTLSQYPIRVGVQAAASGESWYPSVVRIGNRKEGPQVLRFHYRQPIFQYATSGPNAFTQALTATLSFVGAINKNVNTGLSGTLSFIGALIKRTSTGLSGTLSFIGNLVKQTQPKLTGTLTFVGAISKAVHTGLTGTLSFVGSLAKAITKGLSGTLSFIGNLTKSTFTHLAGALSFVGTLVASHVTLVALTAVLNFTGVLSKQTRTGLAGSLSFTGNLFKRVQAGLSGSLSFAGTLVKAVSTHLTAALSFVGSVNVSHLFIVALTATLSFAGNLQSQFIAGITGVTDYIVKIMRRRR